jgi:large subunit ribosomal protein L20
MSRAKRGFKARRRRNELLKRTRGFFGRRKNTYRVAHDSAIRAGVYAYVGRKLKKRDFRSLWIQRINAAARELGLKYSTLMNMLAKANIQLDRRVLAEMAYSDPDAFKAVVESAKTKAA